MGGWEMEGGSREVGDVRGLGMFSHDWHVLDGSVLSEPGTCLNLAFSHRCFLLILQRPHPVSP